MIWEARTAFTEMDVGTRLCIYERMQIAGDPPGQLVGDHEMPIEINDRWVTSKVENADGESAILELWDGRRFKMSTSKPGERASGIISPMHTQDWVIRDQLPD